MSLAEPRQAHGCTSGPSSSPSKHSRHVFSSSDIQAAFTLRVRVRVLCQAVLEWEPCSPPKKPGRGAPARGGGGDNEKHELELIINQGGAPEGRVYTV